jgi:general secretion pathway protein A
MYTSYFGLKEEPFNLTPTSRLFYNNQVSAEVCANLLQGISQRVGLMMLTGEVGTGKTTLLHQLMNTLDKDPAVSVAFSYYSTLTFAELLSFICTDLGLRVNAEGDHPERQAFNDFLLARAQAGGTTVLLIDEAQDLEEEVLENLILLVQPQHAGEKPLQMILVGQQPELEEKLAQPRFHQFRDRITVRCQLVHLKREEVKTFIEHRLRLVGYERQDLFSPEALHLVALYSQGIPRVINLICDNALRATYEASHKTVSARTIQKIAYQLQLQESELIRQELRPSATSSSYRDDYSGSELAEEYRQPLPRPVVRRSIGGVEETLTKVVHSVKTELLRSTRRSLAWSGGVGLLTLLGLIGFTFTVVQLTRRQVPPEAPVLTGFSPHPQNLTPGRSDGQLASPTGEATTTRSLPTLGPVDSQYALRGKAVLDNLAARYQHVHPLVWGLATTEPALALLIPEVEWDSLAKEDQVGLTVYLESLIPAVRTTPDQYIQEFRAAPVYDTFRAKVTNLCSDCWVIGTGQLIPHDQSVLFGKVVVQGDSLWKKSYSDSRGVKASLFRAGSGTRARAPAERTPEER